MFARLFIRYLRNNGSGSHVKQPIEKGGNGHKNK